CHDVHLVAVDSPAPVAPPHQGVRPRGAAVGAAGTLCLRTSAGGALGACQQGIPGPGRPHGGSGGSERTAGGGGCPPVEPGLATTPGQRSRLRLYQGCLLVSYAASQRHGPTADPLPNGRLPAARRCAPDPAGKRLATARGKL